MGQDIIIHYPQVIGFIFELLLLDVGKFGGLRDRPLNSRWPSAPKLIYTLLDEGQGTKRNWKVPRGIEVLDKNLTDTPSPLLPIILFTVCRRSRTTSWQYPEIARFFQGKCVYLLILWTNVTWTHSNPPIYEVFCESVWVSCKSLWFSVSQCEYIWGNMSLLILKDSRRFAENSQ